MESHCGAVHDFLFSTDGKQWRTCRPGKGEAANETMSQVGDSDVSLVQKACCNGHCGFRGLKVSAVLQADGMRYMHAESSLRHDSFVLHKSCTIEMTSQLKVDSDERTPKCSSDKAYGRNELNQLRHTDMKIKLLTP